MHVSPEKCLHVFTALCCWVWSESLLCWEPGCQSSQTVSLSVYLVITQENTVGISRYFFNNTQPIPPSIRSTVRLMIRKVQYAPENPGPAPRVETTRDFLMSDKPLHMEASLEKQVGCFYGSSVVISFFLWGSLLCFVCHSF